MTFDKKAYMRDYMARYRAGGITSRVKRAESALQAIITKLDGNDKALAVELRAIALEGLGES